MEARVVLDTDVVIDYLKRAPDPTVSKLFDRIREGRLRAYTTSVTAFELYRGARRAPDPHKRMLEIRSILTFVVCLNYDEAAANAASDISVTLEQEGIPIEIRDIFIGAIARTSGFPLVTKNVEHFRRIPDLRVIKPSDLLRQIK